MLMLSYLHIQANNSYKRNAPTITPIDLFQPVKLRKTTVIQPALKLSMKEIKNPETTPANITTYINNTQLKNINNPQTPDFTKIT